MTGRGLPGLKDTASCRARLARILALFGVPPQAYLPGSSVETARTRHARPVIVDSLIGSCARRSRTCKTQFRNSTIWRWRDPTQRCALHPFATEADNAH